MTAWIVVTVVWKSWTNWLMDTFITDWSRTMTNWAVANATRARDPFGRVAVSVTCISSAASTPSGSRRPAVRLPPAGGRNRVACLGMPRRAAVGLHRP